MLKLVQNARILKTKKPSLHELPVSYQVSGTAGIIVGVACMRILLMKRSYVGTEQIGPVRVVPQGHLRAGITDRRKWGLGGSSPVYVVLRGMQADVLWWRKVLQVLFIVVPNEHALYQYYIFRKN